ncbi:MAG: MGMT family protein [Bacteroidetes bacterium]|nr:MGMT family protein [Bacteroidota bacterium]
MATQDFITKVHELVRLIPPGRVTSYGAIAKYLGTGLSARMVGYAMGRSHNLVNPVPAHRVLNRNGELSGRHAFDPNYTMEQRLLDEGVEVDDNRVKNWNELFWDPAMEL